MKTSKTQYESFKKEFLRVQNILGLTEWKIYFRNEDTTKYNAFSTIFCDHDGMFAIVTLTNVYEKDEKDDFDPIKHGKHEAIHLLLARLGGEAHSRFTTARKINQEEEMIVRRLEKII